jgi:hypothetical protein
MNSDHARQRAEKRFKQEERARDSQKAMIEYEVQARATREKTARLKALRLAKEAQVHQNQPVHCGSASPMWRSGVKYISTNRSKKTRLGSYAGCPKEHLIPTLVQNP